MLRDASAVLILSDRCWSRSCRPRLRPRAARDGRRAREPAAVRWSRARPCRPLGV